MKRLILTALNNSDEIWYRGFIPFILSLRQTNYSDDIGVIAYDLAYEKRRLLQLNHILVFEPENKFPELLIDRHFTASKIAENYDYLAFYDADIWFSHTEITIFNQIQDHHSLYCSYDVIHPPFLMGSLPTRMWDKVQQKFNQLLSCQPSFWQAGVIAGTKQAWENYFNYIKNQLFYLSEFKMEYGVDATVLNLYACDTHNVSHLSERYNCLPYWGIGFINFNHFTLNDEVVESVHITRYHRDSKEYNYTHLNKLIYLGKGKDFSINHTEILNYFQCGYLFSSLPQNSQFPTLSIEEILCSSLSANIDIEGRFYKKDSFILDCSATSKIVLKNPSNQDIEILFSFQERTNLELPCHIEFTQNNSLLNFKRNILYRIILPPDTNFELITDDIWQSGCGIRYIFNNVRFS